MKSSAISKVMLATVLWVVCWSELIAQPSHLSFKSEYAPHNQLPGEAEASVIMMDALSADEVAYFLNKYWEAGDPEMVFAMLISISRKKAGNALQELDPQVAVGALNYMEPYWALDLIWYLAPKVYEQLAPKLKALESFAKGDTSNSSLQNEGLCWEKGIRKAEIPHPENLRFSDEFVDNRHGWEVVENKQGKQRIANGYYQISHQKNTGGYFIDQGIYIDPQRDFYITTRMQQQQGGYDSFFGLSWGRTDSDNYFVFSINPTLAQINAFYVHKGEKSWILDHVNLGELSEQKHYELGVQKKGDELLLYIDGIAVYRMQYQPFLGQHLGFLLMGEVAINVDYLQVYAPEPKINLVQQPTGGLAKERLGPGVNTEAIEYGAVISADGQSLFFSRHTRHKPDSGVIDTDIWKAERGEDGSWSKAQRMPFPINNYGSNGVVAVSTDGHSLVLNNRYTKEGYPHGDGLSISRYRADGEWEVPKELEIPEYHNELKSVSHTLSPDGNTLIMAVKREDAIGNLDLYFSKKQPDGTWTAPKHTGNAINTPGQESGPFIASDNRTLYFSSDGLPGYGDADIFVTHRLDDTWTKWSTPKNLGPSVNTPHWDGYYTMPASGEYAYLSSYSKGSGHSDIYRVRLAEEAKPAPVVLLKGKIYNAHTRKPLRASIICEDAQTKEVIGKAEPHPKTGVYKLLLPYGKRFIIRAEADKHLPAVASLDFREAQGYREIERDFAMLLFEVGKSSRIQNVFFERGKARLLPASYPELDRIALLMRSYPEMEIRIEGHTDGLGNPEFLQRLSQYRAKSVKDYLAAQGIDVQRIEVRGYGRSKPVAPNDTEANRRKNRRVDLVITKL